MSRRPGLSVRVRLALSYAAFLLIAGALLLAVVYVFLLRYVPATTAPGPVFTPSRFDLIRAFLPPALWALLFLLVLGLVGGWFLAGWMLAPLARIGQATRKVAEGSLAHRIDLEGRSDEFREVADSFDAMLARLEAHDAEQRRFAANASHELRTPLAITQTLLDVAQADPGRDVGQVLERLRAVNTRAIELADALLVLSRAEQRAFAREPVDLSLLAEEAAETLLPLAEKQHVTIEAAGEVALASGSRTLLLQMITNLVHNGIVHNATDGGEVLVRTRGRGADAVLTVENTGPELDPRVVATLTEPFQRATERTRGDASGAGLGLAIVAAIVRAHDGAIALAARPGGGLAVTVTLPAAPAA